MEEDDPQRATIEQVSALADAFVAHLRDIYGPDAVSSLDMSLASLEPIDAMLGQMHDIGQPLTPELTRQFAAYIMETTRRAYGGEYLTGPEGEELVLAHREPDFQVGLMVFGKVRGRVANGIEDNIPFFVAGYPAAIERRRSATLI